VEWPNNMLQHGPWLYHRPAWRDVRMQGMGLKVVACQFLGSICCCLFQLNFSLTMRSQYDHRIFDCDDRQEVRYIVLSKPGWLQCIAVRYFWLWQPWPYDVTFFVCFCPLWCKHKHHTMHQKKDPTLFAKLHRTPCCTQTDHTNVHSWPSWPRILSESENSVVLTHALK
jgi:hypothetical protein